MKKNIPFERVLKITEKLEKAMKTQDQELFNKWYGIAKKEKEEKYFNSIFMSHLKEMAKKPNNEFFNFLIKEVKNEFKKENLKDVLLSIMGSNQVANYNAIQEAWGKDFYNDDFFLSKTASVISCYYIYGFSYDLDNILDLTKMSIISDYCKNIHLSEIKNKDIADSLFNKLPLEQKTILLAHNLEKSIESNKQENIEYFCIKLVTECEVTKDIRDDLLICSLVQTIRKKDDTLYMSFKQKKEAEEHKLKLKELVNTELTDDMLTPGGQFFKFLFDKVELKNKLESLVASDRPTKRTKI